MRVNWLVWSDKDDAWREPDRAFWLQFGSKAA